MMAGIHARWEQPIIRRQRSFAASFIERLAGEFGNFEMNSVAGFLLDDFGPIAEFIPGSNVTHFELHQVAAAKFAIYCKIEQG